MIQIDLRTALTRAVLDAARPAMGSCSYQTCIIGLMVPEEARQALDDYRTEDDLGSTETIITLVGAGLIEFATDDQRQDARQIQSIFDQGDDDENWAKIERIAAPYLS